MPAEDILHLVTKKEIRFHDVCPITQQLVRALTFIHEHFSFIFRRKVTSKSKILVFFFFKSQ
jgi:hypothetical protein